MNETPKRQKRYVTHFKYIKSSQQLSVTSHRLSQHTLHFRQTSIDTVVVKQKITREQKN